MKCNIKIMLPGEQELAVIKSEFQRKYAGVSIDENELPQIISCTKNEIASLVSFTVIPD